MNELHQTGDIVRDRYRILSLLGEGSTGSTYKAIDPIDSQTVAIKVVSFRRVRDWKVLELFEREAKILASLEHPAIPQYLDYFHEDTPEDRCFYLIRELIEGNSLAGAIKAGWHPQETEVKEIAKQILNILVYLHGLNPPVIHRDIKPENIIRDVNGKVFLVDFGGVQEVYRKTLSHSGTFVGTLGYMPPEQFRGKAIFASDLYAVGMTLLYLLTRYSPEDLPQKRMKIDFHSHVSISKKFARWLEKTIVPAIEDRFHSAQEALQALQKNHLVELYRKQPKYSQIVLKKTSERLVINIPQGTFEKIGLIFPLFLNSFVFTSSIAQTLKILLYEEIAGMNLALLICYLVYIILMPLGIINYFKITGRNPNFIALDRKFFQFRWDFLGLVYIIQGKIQDLEPLECEKKWQYWKYPQCLVKGTSILIVGKKILKQREIVSSKRINLIQSLRLKERKWLEAELREFLDRQLD
ncbi:MAG: serine/threonine-protein kinase [Cyanobacteria bacterium P01_E01_bin.42]